MSDKPTVLPRWANGGSAEIVEPSSGKKDIGWDGGETPPAQYFNWLLYNIYAWLLWIFNGAFTRNDTTDNTPVVSFTDAGGNVRNFIDPSGYMFGPAIQECYRWKPLDAIAASQSNQALDGDLMGSTGANCTIDGDRTFTKNSNFVPLKLTILDIATNAAARLHRDDGTDDTQFNDLNNVVLVMEFMMQMDAVGANEIDIGMGFHSDPSVDIAGATFFNPVNYSLCMFEKLSADTNWQASVGEYTGGTGTSNDTGTPPVVNTWQTFRVEYHGLNTPVGVANSNPTARFFIDGVEKAEIANTTLPQSSGGSYGFMDFCIWARATATGPAADFNMYVSPVKFAYNMVLSPSLPT